MKEGGIYIEMYALARIQFQKLSCDHPHAGECTLCSKSVNMFKNVFGKTSLLHVYLNIIRVHGHSVLSQVVMKCNSTSISFV